MKLIELFDFLPKSKHSSSSGKNNGLYPFFISSNDKVKYLDEFDYDGEYLIIGDGGAANCKHYIGKFSASDHNYILRPKSGTNCKLLYYFLIANNCHILEEGFKGVGIRNISKSYIQEINFRYNDAFSPSQIINSLDYIFSLIHNKKENLLFLDELVKSRFIELFGNCKNEVLIGDVISISRGASPRPISTFIIDSEEGVNWIKIGDVSENSLYITKTEEKITPEGAKKSRMVHKGDFILSNSMSFGRPYILGINGCVHDGWLIMSDFKETFNELYLYHAIRSDDVQYQFSGKVNGATVKNLNSDLVKNTFIKVPPMELQDQFATFVEQTDKSKFVCQFIQGTFYAKYARFRPLP